VGVPLGDTDPQSPSTKICVMTCIKQNIQTGELNKLHKNECINKLLSIIFFNQWQSIQSYFKIYINKIKVLSVHCSELPIFRLFLRFIH
jgi:hypothetical protein